MPTTERAPVRLGAYENAEGTVVLILERRDDNFRAWPPSLSAAVSEICLELRAGTTLEQAQGLAKLLNEKVTNIAVMIDIVTDWSPGAPRA